MARRKLWKRLVILAVVILLGGLVSLAVKALYFPERKMFHNYLAAVGEKGPLRFWVTPPVARNESLSQELFHDEHLNLLVVVVLRRDLDPRPHQTTSSGWTGYARFGYDFTLFEYAGHVVKVDRSTKDLLIVLSPEGKMGTAPILPGQASLWFDQMTREWTINFLADLKKPASSNPAAMDLIREYDFLEP